ncbi:hypothetical protein LIS90_13685 [Flavobacterium psychrophilum]|uniref:hypothetical protein n=1 Tax=Flavobacterium psychrophilum TaxID=96345 RepID=UPI001D068F90|nr:hypothetical protein [Flavobacterium psychrophilum]MCB6232298.1 hypothetical protein [Flavobacterium psychrophilum]
MSKKILLIAIAIIFNLNLYSQKKNTIDTLKLENFKLEDLAEYKNKIEVGTLILEDKTIITKGSKLIVGQPSNPVNVNNNVYNGMKVANTSIDFTYVFVDKFSVFGSMAAVALSSNWKGTEILVDEIIMYKSGKTYSFVVNFLKSDGTNVAMGKYGNIRSLIETFKNGEIENPNRGMTREEAIKKLKESKDLLDLEMMTLEEYNKIKEKLTPIIKAEK